LGRIAPPHRTYDKPLLDKLGAKPGMRVAIVGVDDDGFLRQLRERTDDIAIGDPRPDSDLIFLAADSADELTRLADLRRRMKPDGAIWVVSRKGKAATIRDVDVIDAALAAALVDNKVVSFSPTHTSLRLVIRREDREAHRRQRP
jgi:hypothetical protein